MNSFTLLHSEGPKLYILAFLSAIGLMVDPVEKGGKNDMSFFSGKLTYSPYLDVTEVRDRAWFVRLYGETIHEL